MSGTTELPQPKYVDFREYILFQVQRTRNLVRQTDLLLLVTTAVAAVLFTLFLFTLLDHWAFTLGLPPVLRWAGFAVVAGTVLGAILYFLKTSAGRQVSSLFAARTLEQAENRLQNSLLTLVDLEQSNRPSSAAIRGSLEKRAALALNDLDVDHAIDRRPLLHRIYAVLLGVVMLFGYAFFAQKSVAESVYRIMLPWTQAAPPTQTKLLDVQPGNVTVSSGSHVEVSTFVDGKTPDRVWLVYSTADRRIVDERVELQPTEEGIGKFTGVITGENGRGVDQKTTYHLEAGDGRSDSYVISVRPAPHAKITELKLTPPAYTGRPPRTQSNGAIDALEGTTVSLQAETNIPVKTAWVQLYDSEAPTDRSGQFPLKIVDGKQIGGEWTLKIRDDGTYPRFYRIECETADGDREAAPPLHAVVIRPDARPEVRLVDPTADLERPLNATVPLLIEAFDPDFELSGLSVQVERQGQLLSSELLDVAGRQRVRLKHPLELNRLPLMVGDVLNFWVEARDNREPDANRRMTSKLRIRITEPVSPEEAEAQRKEDEQRQQEQLAEEDDQAMQEDQDSPSDEQAAPDSQEAASSEGSEGDEEGTEGDDSESSSKQSTPGENQSERKTDGDKSGNEGNKGEQSNEQPGEGDSEAGEDPNFDPEGADDDRVLEKLIEKMQEESKNSEQSGGENQPQKQDPSAGTGENENTDPSAEPTPPEQDSPGSEATPEGGENMPNGEQPPTSPDSSETSTNPEEGSDTPGEQMQPGNKGNEPKPDSAAENSDQPKGSDTPSGEGDDSTGGEESGESAGSSPSEMQDKPADGETKPGPGEKPAEPGKEPGEPRPSEMDPGGEKRPGDKPGEGDATPGSGDEQGPTERDPNQDPNAPNAQNPLERPDDSMKPGDPSGDSQKQPGDSSSSKSNPGQSPDDQSPDGSASKQPSGEKPAQNSETKPNQNSESPAGSKPAQNQKPGDQTKPSDPTAPASDQTPSAPMSDDQPAGDQPGDNPSQQKGDQPGQGKSEGKGDQPGEGNSPGEGNNPGDGKSPGKSPPNGKPGQGSGTPGEGEGQADPNRQGGGGMNSEQRPDGPGRARGGNGAESQQTSNQPGDSAGGGSSSSNDPDYSMEDRRKAAELVLNQLQEDLDRGEVDPKLLEELGWDKDNLKQFQRRMADYLRNQNGGEQKSLKQRQFDEMLRNMRLDGARNAREGQTGGTESLDEFAPSLTPAPPEYRELEQAFKRSLSGAGSKPPASR